MAASMDTTAEMNSVSIDVNVNFMEGSEIDVVIPIVFEGVTGKLILI